MDIDKIKSNMRIKNKYLNDIATKDSDAIRFRDEEEDIRPPFFRDIDRIIYSLSYTRYMDKTQVFSFNDNDNITKRMTHVQMVSKVARTIGRALGLNEDLIEAAALGHDLGHVPFGHVGERILNEISIKAGEGYFNHNVESVRDLMFLENNGKGFNLTIQVLDAIMCHNGELELQEYKPVKKTKEDFMIEYYETYTNPNKNKELVPMTLEGCVVRISDIIAYIGRDIEDAIRLNLISIDEIPSDIKDVLGVTNGNIIDTIIGDLLTHSLNKNYLKLSDEVFNAIKKLKQFNYEHIYSKANSVEMLEFYNEVFNTVYDVSLMSIKKNDKDSNIYKVFLDNMSEDYLIDTSDERKVIDYIAGMTDDFIVKEYKIDLNKYQDYHII
jgi:dGTPase